MVARAVRGGLRDYYNVCGKIVKPHVPGLG
nr:MAG TPA: hypothetical protein [Caudoviricetes sp.]